MKPFSAPNAEWAYRIVEKHARGEKVNSFPLKMAREVVAKLGNRQDAAAPEAGEERAGT